MSRNDHVTSAKAVYDVAAPRYAEFVGTEISSTTEASVDRSLLLEFTSLVHQGPDLRVADLGCGTGRVAALLAAHDLDVVGLDVSGAMVAVARAAHPEITFTLGRLDGLPLKTEVFGGVTSWYSVMYTPPDLLDEAFAEFARVLLSGGYLLLAFQAGSGEAVRRDDAHGTGFSLTSYRHDLREIVRRLESAGFEVLETRQRGPELEHETTPQAFVIARAR